MPPRQQQQNSTEKEDEEELLDEQRNAESSRRNKNATGNEMAQQLQSRNSASQTIVNLQSNPSNPVSLQPLTQNVKQQPNNLPPDSNFFQQFQQFLLQMRPQGIPQEDKKLKLPNMHNFTEVYAFLKGWKHLETEQKDHFVPHKWFMNRSNEINPTTPTISTVPREIREALEKTVQSKGKPKKQPKPILTFQMVKLKEKESMEQPNNTSPQTKPQKKPQQLENFHETTSKLNEKSVATLNQMVGKRARSKTNPNYKVQQKTFFRSINCKTPIFHCSTPENKKYFGENNKPSKK